MVFDLSGEGERPVKEFAGGACAFGGSIAWYVLDAMA